MPAEPTSKAKIAMLLSNAFRPDTRVLKEANSLAGVGYSITVLCWDRQNEFPSRETLPSGVEILRIQDVPSSYGVGARQLLRLPRFWRAILPLLGQLQPDLIHCHDFDTLPAGLAWGRLHKKPVIYDAHEYYADLCKPRLHGVSGDLLYRLIRRSELWGARMASAVVTVDSNLAAIYSSLNPQILVIGHYPSRALVAEPALVFSRPELNLLYVGRLSQDRGLLIYLSLLQALLNRGIPARLHLAGAFTPQIEKDRFDQAARNLASNIFIHGWVTYDKLPGLLQNVDVGLAILMPEPRYVAALPVKLFEYMAAGLPVIASDFPLVREVINTVNCGGLVDPRSTTETLANELQRWWENPSLPQAFGTNGRKSILEKYNWEQLALQLSLLYEKLLQS